jgi:EAL domain-containing protein (putative c-di-GMP-specific phosphodiesterase class I)
MVAPVDATVPLGVGLGCKFDMSSVHDMADRKEALAIIRAITGMSNSLNIKTTAEGVETQEQMAQLTAEGCTCFQGYLFAKPVPADERITMLGMNP